MNKSIVFRSLLVLLLLAGFGASARAQEGAPAMPLAPEAQPGTAFTYQGRLMLNGALVDGYCDMNFLLYDQPSSGNQVGSLYATMPLVIGGLFTAKPDFGAGAFNGEARWLEIQVRCPSGAGDYTTLGRQALTPAPYALALPGLYTRQNSTSPNLIGGYAGNSVTDGVVGAVIGGGGYSGGLNRVTDDYGAVGGGRDNRAGDGAGSVVDSTYAVVGGGSSNAAGGEYAVIAGGLGNLVDAPYATIAGGGRIDPFDPATGNRVTDKYGSVGGGGNNQAGDGDANPDNVGYATVSGGKDNVASGRWATVGGGVDNIASYSSSTIGGGANNQASGFDSTVGGGAENIAGGDSSTVGGGVWNTASGNYAMIPGGYDNEAAGSFSFAAGKYAKALHDGAFVWADDRLFEFRSTSANTFRARATTGFSFVVGIDPDDGHTTWNCQLTDGNTWSCSSDRALKENLAPVDTRQVLEQLGAMPVMYWNGKGQDPNVRHLGPMAQDFYAAFGLGDDETMISTIDLDGVALASIQGLHEILQEKEAEIGALKEENSRQQAQIDALEVRLAALEQQAGVSAANGRPRLSSASPWLALAGLFLAGVVVSRRSGDTVRVCLSGLLSRPVASPTVNAPAMGGPASGSTRPGGCT